MLNRVQSSEQPTNQAVNVGDLRRQIAIVSGEGDPVINFRFVPEASECRAALAAMTPRERAHVRFKHSGRLSKPGVVKLLKRKNAEGNAIFFTLNSTDGRGVKRENMVTARCLPLDLDGAPLPKEFEIKPHLIVNTSPGKFQCFWPIRASKDLAAYEDVARRLAAHYGGDAAVCDISHVFRAAGFIHWKGLPFRSRIIKLSEFEPPATLGSFSFLPKLPPRLSNGDPGVGSLDADKARLILDELSAQDFAGNDAWLALAMAIHAASGADPDVRDVFMNWSAGDPAYADEGAEAMNRSRWESFRTDKPNMIGIGTLRKICRDHNVSDDVIAKVFNDAADDFDELPDVDFDTPADDEFDTPAEGEDAGEALSALQRLNKEYCTVIDGNFRVMYLDENPDMPGRRYWKSIGKQAFEDHFCNRRIERSGGKGPKTISLGKAWIKWSKRPSAVGMTFDTTVSPGDDIDSRIVDGRLNLWTGFGCKPASVPEGWQHLRAMIRDDLCNGNDEFFQYVLKWIAYKIQNPGLPCETSIVFKGAKGVGKTTLGEVLVDIFGSHGLVVSRRSQFAGQFSGHLATACFVFADEAVWGGNKEDEGTLKKLITDKHVLYRAMYREETYGVNRVGLMMATNETWAVPATFEERRFVVSEVSDRHRVKGADDEKNRAYWNAIHDEIANGGREAFMHDMLNMPLDDWTPRTDAPKTEALGAQIEEGLRGVQRWYYEILTEHSLPFLADGDQPEWGESPQDIPVAVTLREVRDWMRTNRQQAIVTDRGLFKELKTFGWKIGKRTKDGRRWTAPPYSVAIAAMEKRLGRKIAGD